MDMNHLRRINNASYTLSHIIPEFEYRRDDLLTMKQGVVLDWQVPVLETRQWRKAAGKAVDNISNNKKLP